MSSNHNVDSEMGVLGSILLIGKVPPSIRLKLQPHHFYRHSHQELYRGFLTLDAVDFLTVKGHWPDLSFCGGEDYVLELCEYTPSPANIEFYTKDVIKFYKRRQYETLGKKATDDDISTDELDVFAEGIKNETLAADATPVITRIGFAGGDQPNQGCPTGLTCVDQAMSSDGFPKGQMSIVMAYAKVGKSTFMIQAAIHAARTGRNVLYATFSDLGAADIEKRVMKQETGFQKPPYSLDHHESWHFTRDQYRSEYRFDVYDAAAMTSGYDVETFCAWLEANDYYNVVFVDYAQRLTSRDKKATTEYAQASICSGQIARLAKRLKLPIVVGSQITEGTNGSKDITKGSRCWEEDCGLLLKFKRDMENLQSTEASVEIAFNRFGKRGLFELVWNDPRVRFDEVQG